MKTKLTILFTTVFAIAAATVSAQKIKTVSGDRNILKNESAINIEFTYDPDMTVGKMKETAYIAKRTNEMNDKEPGKGDKWAASWVSDRKTAYEPRFLTLFTEHSKMTNNKDAKYTLIFNTKSTEPGFNVGVMRGNAYVDATVTIVETANRNNTVAVITIDDARGKLPMGSDFATSWRIGECYAKAGKELARFLK